MQQANSHAEIDQGRVARWGASSIDYSVHRPDPPMSLCTRLAAFEIGHVGQRVLDLGTGTGALALQFAHRGCETVGTDIDEEQISAAKNRANELGVSANFYVAPAELVPEPDASFDVITANQCWPYFDRKKVLSEVRRILRPSGALVISSFTYLPRLSRIAQESEGIVKRFNPGWTGIDWDGETPITPHWVDEIGRQVGMFTYDEAVPFTRESWKGRMRALRAIGPTLGLEQVKAFDKEHGILLDSIAPETFEVPHRITAYILQLKE